MAHCEQAAYWFGKTGKSGAGGVEGGAEEEDGPGTKEERGWGGEEMGVEWRVGEGYRW